jgi:hypothetical protein
VKVHDIATNKPLNMQSWDDVREIVDKALVEARQADRAEQRHLAVDVDLPFAPSRLPL